VKIIAKLAEGDAFIPTDEGKAIIEKVSIFALAQFAPNDPWGKAVMEYAKAKAAPPDEDKKGEAEEEEA
jgi:hypothetical protein